MKIRLPRRFCAVISGLVFYLAGFFKLMDPTGAGLVVDSYLSFFHLGFLSPISSVIAEALAFAEAFTGLALVTGVYRRIAAKAAFILTGLFTLVTLVLVVANPEMDCGCFGEVVHLSHLQTFIKNLILAALLCTAFLPLRNVPSGPSSKPLFIFAGVVVLAIGVYSLVFLPIRDYTSFAPGERLYDIAKTSSSVPQEPLFVYEKDGFRKEFDLENLPDSTWTFVDTHERPAFTDASAEAIVAVSNASGEVCDSVLLEGGVIAFCVHSPEKQSISRWRNISRGIADASAAGFRPALLVAGSADMMEEILEPLPSEEKIPLLLSMYFADRKTLITLVRSNGGAVYLSDGLVIDKWSGVNLPSARHYEALAGKPPVKAMMDATIPGRITLWAVLLLTVLPVLFI